MWLIRYQISTINIHTEKTAQTTWKIHHTKKGGLMNVTEDSHIHLYKKKGKIIEEQKESEEFQQLFKVGTETTSRKNHRNKRVRGK
jgi:hypothetical protein